MTEILLDIKNLSIEYQLDIETVKAVNDISFILKKKETLGIVGETGAGKTTMALAIMRLLPKPVGEIVSGNIIFENQDIMELKEIEMQNIRGEKISMIFQDPMTSLNPIMTVGAQIKESLVLHNHDNRTDKEIDERVEEVLELVGIPAERKNDYPLQFSGGMKQRVVIAIALACSPDLIIADEPTTALDVTIQAQVLALMKELKDKLKTSMVMITHDLGIVAQTCDNIAVMYAGEIVEYGNIDDIFTGENHHPYTEGLFGSIPNVKGERVKRLTPIDGLMPDPTNLPKGCKFSPRCKYVMDICKEKLPKDYIKESHKIKCHLYERWNKNE